MPSKRKQTVSDTVTVTSDGRMIVDIPRLFQKQHMQDLITSIHSKTVRVRRDQTEVKPHQVEATESA